MFDQFFEFVASILSWFYSLVPSYGFAIIALTVTVMVVITPLTLKSTRSMLQLQRLQPELKRLQEKYKGDREKLNAEMMAFYKEHQINPVGGCVPMLAQAPVFLILYRVLRGITERAGGGASGIGHAAGRLVTGQAVTGWKVNDQPFRPQHLGGSGELFHALSNTTKMNFLGVDLAISPADAFRVGLITFIPFGILMILMLVSQIIQNRQIQGRNQNNNASSQQQFIMKVLPFMLPVISFSFPAGLGVYYFVQGLCRIGTQSYITRKFYGENAPAPVQVSDKERAPDVKGGTNGSKPAGTKAADKSETKPADKRSGPSGAAARGPSQPARKPGNSPRSQAAQRKSGGQVTPGRRSGTPRSKPPGNSN